MVRTYGLVPCSIDSHIGEYVDFALDVTDWHPVPLDFHEPVSLKGERLAELGAMADSAPSARRMSGFPSPLTSAMAMP